VKILQSSPAVLRLHGGQSARLTHAFSAASIDVVKSSRNPGVASTSSTSGAPHRNWT